MIRSLVGAWWLVGFAGEAEAADRCVPACPSGVNGLVYSSLKNAVTGASFGETIWVTADLEYPEATLTGPTTVNKDLTIISAAPDGEPVKLPALITNGDVTIEGATFHCNNSGPIIESSGAALSLDGIEVHDCFVEPDQPLFLVSSKLLEVKNSSFNRLYLFEAGKVFAVRQATNVVSVADVELSHVPLFLARDEYDASAPRVLSVNLERVSGTDVMSIFTMDKRILEADIHDISCSGCGIFYGGLGGIDVLALKGNPIYARLSDITLSDGVGGINLTGSGPEASTASLWDLQIIRTEVVFSPLFATGLKDADFGRVFLCDTSGGVAGAMVVDTTPSLLVRNSAFIRPETTEATIGSQFLPDSVDGLVVMGNSDVVFENTVVVAPGLQRVFSEGSFDGEQSTVSLTQSYVEGAVTVFSGTTLAATSRFTGLGPGTTWGAPASLEVQDSLQIPSPGFQDAGSSTACEDLSLLLTASSPLRDAGDPSSTDVDGTRLDLGAYGGLDAALYDLDLDGAFTDLDCDDTDPTFGPEADDVPYDDQDQDCDGFDLVDVDQDGFVAIQANGDDCDDSRADVYPGAIEVWYDGQDGDCGGDVDYDQDGDGSFAVAFGGADCDDTDALVQPDAAEVWYDGIDQDCDGNDLDQDGDGHETPFDGDGFPVPGGDDCNDLVAAISPSAVEVWYDGIDQDCDGNDLDQDGDGHDALAHGGDDCDDLSPLRSPSAIELYYDGLDQDCDPANDDDRDGDGQASVLVGGVDCDDADEDVGAGFPETWYDGVDQSCDGNDLDRDLDGHDAMFDSGGLMIPGGDDCNDTLHDVHPGAVEVWYDGVDQDCDGNDGDQDGDGFDAVAAGGLDCDDLDPLRSPGSVELYYDGIDQDCDPSNDDDQDGDGAAGAFVGGPDCNDQDASIGPDVAESWYDGIDQNCDGNDLDADGDGHDVPSDLAGNAVPGGDDCNDLVASVHGDAVEIWYDGVDQDCDGNDLDQDGDGVDSDEHGGEDCDDTDPKVFPGAIEDFDPKDLDCDGWGDPSGPVTPRDCGGCVTGGASGSAGLLGAIVMVIGLRRRRY